MVVVRAVWSAPGGQNFQGINNVLQVQINNTIKRAIRDINNALLMDHQQEDVVSGGGASSIQFHYLLVPDTTENTSATVVPDAQVYDANEGASGSSEFDFGRYDNRRDFAPTDRGF